MAARMGPLIRDELNKLQHIHTIKPCTDFKRESKAVLYVSAGEKLQETVSEKRKMQKRYVHCATIYIKEVYTHTHLRTILKMC